MSHILIDGHRIETNSEHFNCSVTMNDQSELSKLNQFPLLKSADFADANLTDNGLAHVCRNPTLENLNLQGTQITNDGIGLLKNLPNLRYLRLKGNPQLSNDCVEYLAELTNLVDLAIHETSVDQNGLIILISMDSLRDICLQIDDGNFTHDGLLELSRRMPNCSILAKGDGQYLAGEFKYD